MGEVELALLLCGFLAGAETETRQYFDANGLSRYVRIDCETETHVIEVGLDGTSSARDSLHQALFFAELTGKEPVVILIDRDGFEGRFEYEMRRVTDRAGVIYLRCPVATIQRWAATAPFRALGGDKDLGDVPVLAGVAQTCDFSRLAGSE